MTVSAALQLSLVSGREWAALFGRVDRLKQKAVRRLSRTQSMFTSADKPKRKPYPRTLSMPEEFIQHATWKVNASSDDKKKKKDA